MMKNNVKNTLLSFTFNFISLCFYYSVPIFVFYSLGQVGDLNFVESFVASSFTFLIGSFVPIPGATGGLEYGFVDFFKVFYSGALLSAGMLLWRLVTYYFSMFIGGITLITYRRKEE